jgi:SAM-dependent methyltransferase
MRVLAETIDPSSDPPNIPSIEWNWESAGYLAEWHEPIFDLMARYVPSESTVLEVGAGGSHTIGAIARRLDCRCFGIEPDDAGICKSIDLARQEGVNVEMICGDGFQLPFEDNLFDVVYSLGLIEHFEPEQSAALVKEHVRVCTPRGLVIVGVPNSFNLPHTLRKWILGSRYEFYPERSYSPGQLSRLMSASGLAMIDRDGVSPMWGLRMAPSLWRVVDLLDRLGISHRLSRLRSPAVRSSLGYMTYAIGRK